MAATLTGLLLVSGAALWGIDTLHQDYGVALDGYQRLRQTYVAAAHLQTAQKLLQWPHPAAIETALAEVLSASTDFDLLAVPRSGWNSGPAAEVRDGLRSVADSLRKLSADAQGPPDVADVEAQRDRIVGLTGVIARLSGDIRLATERAQSDALRRRHTSFAVVGSLSLAVVLATVVLGVLHHRSVMKPIGRLSDAVGRLAAGRLQRRDEPTAVRKSRGFEPSGRDELASLARDFHRMARELDGFYAELEQKVAAKSRELVRSERLASVGYLAAGVAHEINNPLGIILGYAEFALAEMRRPTLDHSDAESAAGDTADSSTPPLTRNEIEKSLQVICDEAVRCKQITQRLLSLARGDDGERSRVSVGRVVRDVAEIVGKVREHRAKRLTVRPLALAGDHETDEVIASEQELRQVVLNLAVNALEAIDPGGEVLLEVGRIDRAVRLTVSDNGCGMSPETLGRVFEPFFTDKPVVREVTDGSVDAPTHDDTGLARRGVGLGLAICHAIVQSHGGRIWVESDGRDRGSRFTVELPPAGEPAIK